jgi:nitroreductase
MTSYGDLLRQRFGLEGPEPAGVPPNETVAGILGRRSIRKYRDEAVPDDLLRVLLACAQSAPAKSDLQQYSIVRLTDPAKKAKLAELAVTEWLATAPVLLVFCGDLRRAWRISELRGKTYGQNTLDSFMNAAVDAGLALQAFVIAAEAAGLGCCPISQVRVKIEETAALLELPDGVFPLAGLSAGWPDEERAVTLRLPPALVVHENRYDDGDVAAEIDGYDRRRDARFPIPPRGQMHNDLYGKAEFYGWSEHVARRLSRPEGREGLRAFLQSRGFKLA